MSDNNAPIERRQPLRVVLALAPDPGQPQPAAPHGILGVLMEGVLQEEPSAAGWISRQAAACSFLFFF